MTLPIIKGYILERLTSFWQANNPFIAAIFCGGMSARGRACSQRAGEALQKPLENKLTSPLNSCYLSMQQREPESGPESEPGICGGMKLIKIIFLVLMIILGATFCTVNRQEIFLHYFFGWSTGPFPLFLLILASLIGGLILGSSVGWGERGKLRAQARQLKQQVIKLQEGIEPLKVKQQEPEPLPPAPDVPKPPLP